MWPFRKPPAPEAPAPKQHWTASTFSSDPLPPGEAQAKYTALLERLRNVPAPSGGKSAMDACEYPETGGEYGAFQAGIPEAVLGWFSNTVFLGYQNCAILGQNWLIDKACTMPARDAIRHGFDMTFAGVDDDALAADLEKKIAELNKAYALPSTMVEFVRMGRMFGIRHLLFDVEPANVDRREWLKNPFNMDSVSPGSYKGMVQIDPYWMVPGLGAAGLSDPTRGGFYDPEYWNVGGLQIHKSHFAVFIPTPVADILKPMYQYGGVSVPQRIVERVYAAERTANEAPQLALSKRLDILKTDLSLAMTNHANFAENMRFRSTNMNNYGLQVVDNDDTMERFDTSLADLDVTIMTQYQLVAAGANVPATKLLGTTPKGFNSSGEYEEASYHEELETIQKNDLTPIVERHIAILLRSEADLGIDPDGVTVTIHWEPVDSPTAKEVAEIQELDSRRDVNLVNAGAIDGEDVRQRLRTERHSGYTDLSEERPLEDLPDEELTLDAPA